MLGRLTIETPRSDVERIHDAQAEKDAAALNKQKMRELNLK